MRAIVWVGGILALNVLFISVLVFLGVIRRVQIARTRRELERMGFVVSVPYASETGPPIWSRLVAVFAGLVALIVTTSVLTAAPSARTQASSGDSSFQGVPTDGTVVPPGTDPGSEQPVSQPPTASQSFASPQASAASSPAADAGSDAGAPSTVTALPASTTAIQLEWAAVSGAASYDIERSIDTVAWNPVVTTDGGQTQYTDVALSSGTTYYYRVVAFVDGQDVSSSDVVSATTTVDTSTAPVLTSPTGSATSLELEWSDVDGELGYRIERSPDGTSWTVIGTTGEGLTSYTDTGLAPATTFYYRVVAVTSDGESPPSTVLSATTGPDGPPTSEPNADPARSLEGP